MLTDGQSAGRGLVILSDIPAESLLLAAQPLFDLSTIDLTEVAVPPDVVGGINPQSGPMRQLDHLIWLNDDSTVGLGVKSVRDDEFWVAGHIPGRPLLPGVLMIEAAAQMSSILHTFAHSIGQTEFLGFTRCNDVVFRGQVVPGDTLYLLAKQISFRRRQFVSSTQAMVDGRLVFEATITGMIL